MRESDRIRRLEDRASIERLKYEYARRLDDGEWGAWADLFTEDATGSFEGWGDFRGRDELRDFATATLADAFEYTAHVMHHPVIDVDGSEGSGEWYVEIHYALADGHAGWRQGRYADEFERTDDGWRFSSVSHEFFARKRFEYEVRDDDRFGEIVEFGGAPPG